MYPREMGMSSRQMDGEGEGKSLAYERGSVRGERFCVIINVYVHVTIQLKNNKLLAATAVEKRNHHFSDHPGISLLGRIL